MPRLCLGRCVPRPMHNTIRACRLRALLSAPEASTTLALALSSIESSALASAAKAVARHVQTLPDASRSASTQQVVTAQQHLMLALPSAPLLGGDAWGVERERLVQAFLGPDEVRVPCLRARVFGAEPWPLQVDACCCVVQRDMRLCLIHASSYVLSKRCVVSLASA